MAPNKSSFIQFAIQSGALVFGEFILKSNRLSPYFFNTGLFYTGNALKQMGVYYAELFISHGLTVQHLFGPAYKGILLTTATAVALSDRGINTNVTFNRKEPKDHGEKGLLIGSPLHGPTVMIDDVITAGTAFRESQALVQAQGGQLTTVLIALDRCERGQNKSSALTEIRAQGIAVHSIINFFDLMDYLKEQNDHQNLKKLEAYYERYGVI